MKNHSLFIATLIFFLALPAFSAEGDIPGSADHPVVGRFDGSVISGYDQKDFDEYRFSVESAESGDNNVEVLEGEVEHIAYTSAAGASMAEVYRNYKNKLEGAGYDILFECDTKTCGGGKFAYALKVLPIPRMVLDPFHYRYLAARSTQNGRVSSIAIVVSPDANNQIRSQISVVLSGELENKMVDAEQMHSSLLEQGHIALYGIYFDSDKAQIKPESKPTLNEIARLLVNNEQLKIILVGHTDNQGSSDYNQALSQRRSKSVLEALVSDYHIGAARLSHDGVGFLAPVASNATEAGRALNRRVELVEAN